MILTFFDYILTIQATYFRRLSGIFMFLILGLIKVVAQPLIVNFENQQLNFLNSERTVITDFGNNGISAGSIHRYDDVFSNDTLSVFGLISIVELNNATITDFDADYSIGLPGWFQPDIKTLTSSGGYVLYRLQLFSNSGEEIYFKNISLTGIDLDGINQSDREFVEVGGVGTYTVDNSTQLTISSNSGTRRVKFLGKAGFLNGHSFENSSSFISNITNPTNEIYFEAGQTGGSCIHLHSLQFGTSGGTFTTPTSTVNPFLVAVDDVVTVVNSSVANTNVLNVISNDYYLNQSINTSNLKLTLLKGATSSLITLNTTTGYISVGKGTPAGTYSIHYQSSMINPSGINDSAEVTINVLESDLEVTTSILSESVSSGENVVYTLNVTNYGPTVAKGVVLTDVLKNLSFVSSTSTIGTWNGLIWNIGSVESGATVTATLVAKVASSYEGNVINTATVSSTSYDPVATNNTSIKIVNVSKSYDLSVLVSDSIYSIYSGNFDTIYFTVTNHGPSDATSILLNVSLSGRLTSVIGQPSFGTWNSPTWNIGELESGKTVVLRISAKVISSYTGIITNSANFSNNTSDSDPDNDKSTDTTLVNPSADLSILQTPSISSIISGDVVTYTLNITNNGPGNASSVQLSDNLPDELYNAQYSTNNGVKWYTWSSPLSLGTFYATESRKILIKVQSRIDLSNNTTIINEASISSSTPDYVSGNNHSSSSVTYQINSDLSVQKSNPVIDATGEKISYSILITNNGPAYSRWVEIEDTLCEGIFNAEYSLNNGVSWKDWTGNFILPELNFSGTISLKIRGYINPDYTGNLINSVYVSSITNDPDTTNNHVTVTTNLARYADLQVVKVQTASPVLLSDTALFEIIVRNNGSSTASNVVIYDTIRSDDLTGVQFYNGLSWQSWNNLTAIGSLSADSSFSLQLKGVVKSGASNPLINVVRVSSTTNDSILWNNVFTSRNYLNNEIDLSVSAIFNDSIAGDTINYIISVINHSPSFDAFNLTIVDALDRTMVDSQEYSVDDGATWKDWTGITNAGTLVAGDSLVLLMRGMLSSGASDSIENQMQVFCDTPDPDLSDNILSLNTKIYRKADISITQIILDPSNIISGSKIEYVLTFSNNGPSDASDFVIKDLPLYSEIINLEASYNGSSYFTWPGVGSINAGTLLAGKTGTLFIRGIINSSFIDTLTNEVSVSSGVIDQDTTNNISTISAIVLSQADLKIIRFDMTNPAYAGGEITYTLDIQNDGPSMTYDAVFAHHLPAVFENAQYSINGGTSWKDLSESNSIGSIDAGESIVLLIKAGIKSSVPNGTVAGDTIEFNNSFSQDPSEIDNSAWARTTILTSSDLMITVLTDDDKPDVGEQFTLKLVVKNNGPSNASLVEVSEVLPSGFTYLSDNSGGNFDPIDGIWKIGTLNSSIADTLLIVVRANLSGAVYYSANIIGDQVDPDQDDNESTIVINTDYESVYCVNTARNVDSYSNGDILATVIDGDGVIKSASYVSLPSGIGVKVTDGTIYVANSTLLVAGENNVTVNTTDEKGFETIQTVLIPFLKDNETVYYPILAKNENDYAKGEILASLYDGDGEITSAQKVSGNLPSGSTLNTSTGIIYVTDPSIIEGGTYVSSVKTTDNTGGQTIQNVTITVSQDNEALYFVSEPKLFGTYSNEEVLASVTDDDGTVISAKLTSGSLPHGSMLNESDGTIAITDISLLVIESTTARIETVDITGGVTSQLVYLKTSVDDESIYNVPTPRNIDSYINGDTLAWVTDANGVLNSVKIVTGTLPPGTALDTITGLISIINNQLLAAKNYPLTIETTDNVGNKTTLYISLEIIPDLESIYHIELSQNIYSYNDGEILATATDGDGQVVSAVITTGTLPSGMSLNTGTGAITVSDKNLLIAGSYQINIKTTDDTGGTTLHQITLTLIASDLAITGSYQPLTLVAGESVQYNLTITNNGPSQASGIILTDIIPSALVNLEYSSDQGTNWTNWNSGNQIQISALENGSSINLLIKGAINSSYTGLIRNTFTVNCQNDDTNSGNNTLVLDGQVIQQADLSIEKTDGKNDFIPGDTITYTITVRNLGPSSVSGARVTDLIPSGASILQWDATGTTGTQYNSSGISVLDELVNMPSNSSIIYSLQLSVSGLDSDSLENVALVEMPSGVEDLVTTNNSASDIDIENSATTITITKESEQTTVTAGDTIIYTLKAKNLGPAEAFNVVITDELPSGVTFLDASTGGIYLDGTVSWSIANMHLNSSFAAVLELLVNSDLPGGTVIKNSAVVTSDNLGEPVESNQVEIVVQSLAKLVIEKQVSSDSIIAGNELIYSITILNEGPSNAIDVVLTDTLPSGMSFVSATNGGISANSIISWSLGNLLPGRSQVCSMVAKVGSQIEESTILRNVAWSSGSNTGSPVISNETIVIVTSKSSLTIEKEGVGTITAGELLTYTLHITNNGPSDAINVLVSDTLLPEVSFHSGSAGINSSGDVVTWSISQLGNGESINGTITVLIDETLKDKTIITNQAMVEAENSESMFQSKIVETIVQSIQLNANDDIGQSVNGFDGGIGVADVIVNDRFDGEKITIDDVVLSLISVSGETISLDEQNGEVIVGGGTPKGNYELVYSICLKEDPQVCDEATVTLPVQAPEIVAKDDEGVTIDNYTGGIAVTDVTSNDLFNGKEVNHSDVVISLVNSAADPGITLNTTTGEVYVAQDITAGNYNLTYQICDLINQDNCSLATVTITITDFCDFIIPDAFSPNGDGIHDYFMITCLTRYPDAKLSVYNRWGNLVFKKENYGNENKWGYPDAWWDGTSTNSVTIGNQKLPTGTYFYILDFNDGSQKPKTGSVFLSGEEIK